MALLQRLHVHPHISSEREKADGVVDAASLECVDFWSPPQSYFVHGYRAQACGDPMSEFMQDQGNDKADDGAENNHFVLVSSDLICLSSRKSMRVSRIRNSRDKMMITPWRNFRLPVTDVTSRKISVKAER